MANEDTEVTGLPAPTSGQFNSLAFTKNRMSGALLALYLGATVGPVSAQASKVEAATGGLEEIVVTARKRVESIQDTPISITAFTGADLQARQLDNISQIGESTPNLVLNSGAGLSGSSANTTIFIRGVGQLDFTLNTEPAVGLYVDEVLVSRSTGSLIDLNDIERVEVLRGPQGTLFGRNTTGGAVSITTTKPHEEFEARLGATVGADERLDVYGLVNFAITDNFFNRTSIKYKERDGYYTRLQDGADIANVDSWGARTAFRWLATENLEIDLSVDGTRERQGARGLTLLSLESAVNDPGSLASLHNAVFAPMLDPSLAFPFGPMGPPSACLLPGNPNPACYNEQWLTGDNFETNAGVESRSDLDLWGTSVTVNWDLGAISLKSISAYREVESDSTMDLDQSPLRVFGVTSAEMDNETFTQELQALGTAFDDRLDWMVGLYYLDEDGVLIEPVSAVFADLTSGGRTTTESKAFFTQGTYRFTDKLSATVGIRYTDDEREYTPDSVVLDREGLSLLPPGTHLLPPTPAKIAADDWTPMINLSYEWTDDFMIYATYSEGFKGGGFTQRVAEPQLIVPSFEPEFVTVYEIGSKFQGLDNRLRLNTAIFFTDYEDLQVLGSQPGALGTVTINAGEAEIKGFEAELTYLPMADLQIQIGVGYLDAEYTSFTDAVADPIAAVNNELPNTPEWSWNASVSYDILLSDGHRLTPRLDWSYRDSVVHEFDNEPSLGEDSYSLLNAVLAFESADGAWLAVLSGKNLTDEEYLVTAHITSGMAYGTYALPRTWAVNVERRF